MIAATSQYNPGARAGDQRYDTAGYPGVNGVRHKTVYDVDRAMLEQLRTIGRAIGWEAAVERRRFQGDPAAAKRPDDTYNFLGKSFQVGSTAGERSFANADDVAENMRQVRNARAFADKVIVSLHCHDLGGPTLLTAKRRTEVDDLADFAIDFGRRSIDAGADIFLVHGHQVPLAVELYKGKPMLHGIGAFIFQVETMKFLPAEAYERYGLGDRATPADFIEARYQGDTRGHAADPGAMGADVRPVRFHRREFGRASPLSHRSRLHAPAQRSRPPDAGRRRRRRPRAPARAAAVGQVRHEGREARRHRRGEAGGGGKSLVMCQETAGL